MDKCKIAKKETKRAESEARTQTFDRSYQYLGTKEGEKYLYIRLLMDERKIRDLDQMKCIKDEEGIVLV